ncbi:MAG TPA: NAD-dependent epimerase/dehydratase family protein [Paracoccaceae bacterium]|nr:NAD-dependent epimerase/dehydratase family protein [Paracoccaceae bacterium]
MPQTTRPRACILGAAGFIGRHAVSEFLARGYVVTAADRSDRLSAGLAQHRRLDFRCGSLHDDGFVHSVLAGADVIVCLAPNSLPATSNADLAAEIGNQVQTTLRIAEFAQQAGCKMFVFASSGGTVYGIDSPTPIPEIAPTLPRNAYGVSKLAIEHYLRILRDLRGMRTISLRISNPYGAGQNANSGQGFIAMAMRRAFGREPMAIWGDGKAVRDFVYVKDLAEAIVLAGEYAGEAYVLNIGSGLGYSLIEIATMVEEITGRPLKLRFEPQRRIDVAKNVLDISLAFRELGWRPRTAIEAGLAATTEWWAARHIIQG